MFNYYKTPKLDIFNQIKEKSIELWNTYDNEFWYVDEKVDRIKDIENYKDNVWFIVWMFDTFNQYRLLQLLEWDAQELLREYILYNSTF